VGLGKNFPRGLSDVITFSKDPYDVIIVKREKQCRARNNGWSTDYVRPECGVVRSNSFLAGHFDQLLSVKEQTNLHFN
jgi:hypothetical protein